MIWFVVLAILGMSALFVYLFRTPIVNKCPATRTLYNAFSIDVSSLGLKIYDVAGQHGDNEGVPVLFVNGKIKNTARDERDVPMVKLGFVNGNGEEIGSWVVEPSKTTLKKGEVLEFVTQYPNPPIDAKTLTHSFIGEGAIVNSDSEPSQSMPLTTD